MSQDFGIFYAVIARIRRLRKSPQYDSVVLQGENDSLRKSPQNFRKHCAKEHKNPGSRNSPLSGYGKRAAGVKPIWARGQRP